MMTNEERERLAYAEGYTETAAVLARLADAERAADDDDELRDRYRELVEEHDDTSDELEQARRSIDELGCQLHDTRAMLEQANDQVKNYRAALMALESEVSPRLREFIREVLG